MTTGPINSDVDGTANSSNRQVPDERRTLWIVLLLNAMIAFGFFGTGLAGDSSALIETVSITCPTLQYMG